MHLLFSNDMLLQFTTLFLNVFDMLSLLSTPLVRLWDAPEDFLHSLYSVVEVSFTAVRHILHHIQLLLQICDLFIHCFALFKRLLAKFKIYLL